jgi:hypothetical protein
VKTIRENWQVPEEYLREIKEKQGREEEKKIEYIKIKPAAPTAQVDAQAEGKTSKMLEVVLEEKRREIIKEWINSGRIKDINSK